MKKRDLPHRLRRWSAIASVALIITACGMPEDHESLRQQARTNFSDHIAMGRRVAYDSFNQQPHGAALLALVADLPLIKLASDDNSQTSGWETYDVTSMPAVADAALLDNAIEMLATRTESLGIKADEMTPMNSSPKMVNDNIKGFTFQRSFQGYLVRDAFIDVYYTKVSDKTSALREIVNRSFGPITLLNPDASESPAAAISDAIGTEDYTVVSQRRLIFPKNSGQKSYLFYLATEFTIHSASEDNTFVVTLEDGTGHPLEAYSHRSSATRSLLHAKVYQQNYMDGTWDAPLSLTQIAFGSDKQTTDLDGGAEITAAGSATATLASVRGTVYDGSAGVSLNFSAQNSASQTITVDTADMPAANAYIAVQRVNAFVRRQLAASQHAYLSLDMKINVNKTDSNCNAFYDSSTVSINFYKAANGCANTALINDVIYHEWTHGLDDHVGKSQGISDNAFSEGVADIDAGFLIGTSELGIGFNLNSRTPIRSLNNTKKYPADKNSDPHAEGQIISGAFWDLRQGLIASRGAVRGAYLADKLFLQHMTTTDSYTDSYQGVLRADDIDGNPATKSPNYCVITAAFAKHGLATADVCQDPAETSTIPLISDIFAGIASEDAGGVTLMASTATTAAAATLCMKERADCASAAATDLIDMSIEGSSAGRLFFVAKNKVTFTEQKILTVLLKDATGQVIGGRTLKFISK